MPRLLDTYETERQPHQRKMINLAVNLGRLMMPRNRAQEAITAGLIGLLTKIPLLREAMSMRGSALQPHYRRGCVGSGAHAGRYLPQPRIGDTPLDEKLGNRFSVIGVGVGPTAMFAAEDAAWLQHLGTSFVRVGTELDVRAPHVFVIRPDRFVFGDGPPSNAPRLVTALRVALHSGNVPM